MSIEQSVPPSAASSVSRHDPGVASARWIHFAGDPLACGDLDARYLLGGKGLSLHLLKQAGLAIPPAFTITTEACRHYHAHNRQWPEGLWEEIQSAVSRLESMTGRRFGRGTEPMILAVRSGAAESMPGLMATILNCGKTESCLGQASDAIPQTSAELPRPEPGPSSEDAEAQLHQAVSAVLDSWNTPAVQRFCELRGLESLPGTAVTIQAMFAAEISGVAFSQDPESRRQDAIAVEAVVGLGSALVGGQITPTRWSIDRQSCAIRHASIPGAAATNGAWTEFVEKGLPQLWHAMKQIEAIYRGNVDVEFGYARGELTFFQARPMIHGPEPNEAVERVRDAEIAHLRQLAHAGRPLWVRHNLGETLPAPTPLTWDLWREFMSGQGGYGALYRRLGYRPSASVRHDGFLELIAGKIYADPDRLTEMIGTSYPLHYDADALRTDPNVINRPPTRLDLERLDPWFLWKWPWLVMRAISAARSRRKLAVRADHDFDEVTVPSVRAYVTTERQVKLSFLSITELLDLFERRRQRIFNDFAPQTLLPGTLGAAAWANLEQRLLPILGAAECQSLLQEWSSRIANPLAFRERELLHQIGLGEITVDRFLDEYGHRGPNEMDLSAPRWREQPAKVQEVASRLATTLPTAVDNQSWPVPDERLRIALVRNGAGCLHRELSPILRDAIRLVPYRELGKHEWLKAYDLLRDVIVELAQRFNLADGIHFLTIGELRTISDSRQMESAIAARQEIHRTNQQLPVPAVLEITEDLTDFGRVPAPTSRGCLLTGTAISCGVGSGCVHLLTAERTLSKVPSQAIIVASVVDPGWLPFLADAAAIVIEQGGMLSHVALLARQLSIPMVVVPDITRQVRDGEAIRVDGDRGWIELTDRGT